MPQVPPVLLVLAGLGQLVLVAASLAIPRVLGWRAQLAVLPRMTQQVFWTYAAYVVVSHVAFGLVSLLAPGWLLDGSPLARASSAFIALWWASRLAIGLFVFDEEGFPDLPLVRVADRVLLALFGGLAVLYAWAALAPVP